MMTFECPEPLYHSLLYDWRHHLKLFGLCGTIKPWEEEGDLLSASINDDRVCKASPAFVWV